MNHPGFVNPPTTEELTGEILERLGGDPAEVVYSVCRQDVARTLAEKMLEGEVDLDVLSTDALESLLLAGVDGASEIDWQQPIHFRLEQAWDALFNCYPETEPDEGPLVERFENAARLGEAVADGWLEASYEDRSNDDF